MSHTEPDRFDSREVDERRAWAATSQTKHSYSPAAFVQEAVRGCWLLLAIALLLIIWYLASSAADRREPKDAEANVIATLFVPETATAEAEAALG